MLMETSMMEIGLMMPHLGKELMYILMVPDMKVNGLTTINMVMVLKYGLMEQSMKVSINLVKRMEKDN